MSNSLYTVTLTDLGTYRLTVAADGPGEAGAIAKAVLFDEATTLPFGMRIDSREATATAELAPGSPSREYRVRGTFSVDFDIMVPAGSEDEARNHARRIYAANPFPFEHESYEPDVRWHTPREVMP